MNDISIVIAGSAGQGIETVADFMASVLKHSGYHVYSTREFMSRIRGGTNSIQLRIHNDILGAYTLRSDIIIPLTVKALNHLKMYDRLQENSTIIIDESIAEKQENEKIRVKTAPLKEVANEVGGAIYINTVAAGAVLSLFDINESLVSDYFNTRFGSKGKKVVENNMNAYTKGIQLGRELLKDTPHQITPEDKSGDDDLLISGALAVALGAIAGGCNFISSYPMSPSTGVLTYLSQKALDYGIIVDQAEDEISAINKGLGAWYAGARAMVTTSGGGFALMNEGLSLAGITETPMVIHLAQRPGPATGLPTRTEQGDLMYALHAGHGEFPRIIYSPGSPTEAFNLTHSAFNMADEYQIPVIILTDQYLLDSTYTCKSFDLTKVVTKKHITKTKLDYQRYKLTDSGVSPRGVPGYGAGLVRVDSDEHDENGNITENLRLRVDMVEKRLRKYYLIREKAMPPTLINEDPKKIVVTWGSNYYCVREAMEKANISGLGMLHFSQLYPLHKSVSQILKQAENVFMVENNATGQFAKLLHQETGYKILPENQLLKYDGLPFPVEQVTRFLQEMIL